MRVCLSMSVCVCEPRKGEAVRQGKCRGISLSDGMGTWADLTVALPVRRRRNWCLCETDLALFR